MRAMTLSAADLAKVDGGRGTACGSTTHCGYCGCVSPTSEWQACGNTCPSCGCGINQSTAAYNNAMNGGGACFVAGTPITMADGSTKPIESIAIGDVVRAYDERACRLVDGRVDQLFVHAPHEAPELVRVNRTLITTPKHSFFVNGRWVKAAELVPNYALQAANSALATPLVSTIEAVAASATVYNIGIGRYHDYFAGGVLVHNMYKY